MEYGDPRCCVNEPPELEVPVLVWTSSRRWAVARRTNHNGGGWISNDPSAMRPLWWLGIPVDVDSAFREKMARDGQAERYGATVEVEFGEAHKLQPEFNWKGVRPGGINGRDIIIPEKYFGRLDFEYLSDKNQRELWSLSSGGLPLRDFEWTIDVFHHRVVDGKPVVHRDLSASRWVIPKVILEVMGLRHDAGREEIKRTVAQNIYTLLSIAGIQVK